MKMKKIFIALFFCIAFCNCVFGESIKETKYSSNDPKLKVFNEENFPVMYNYFLNYAQMFLYKFDITKYPKPGFVEGSVYKIHKNGEIEFCYNPPPESSFYNWPTNDFRKFILNNPPPPFPKEMEDDEIKFDLDIGNEKYQDFNSIEIKLYRQSNEDINTLSVNINKHKRNMHMSKRKCKKLGYEWNEKENYCKLDYKLFLNYEEFDMYRKK